MNFGEENKQVEFKKSTGELKEAICSIVAILNKHGAGNVYFGVRNDGTVVGQNITDHTLREVSQVIRTHIRPVIYPEITKEMVEEVRLCMSSSKDMLNLIWRIIFHGFA